MWRRARNGRGGGCRRGPGRNPAPEGSRRPATTRVLVIIPESAESGCRSGRVSISGRRVARGGARVTGRAFSRSFFSSTCASRSRAYSSTRSARAASAVPRIRAASRPALRAPPMETVATGMPAGICTMDSRESMPSRYARGTGTPTTGSGVIEASIPGRWAAPPAPAMMTRMPRERASRAYDYELVRGAVCGYHLDLVRDAEVRERLGRVAHHTPVGVGSHHDADQRLGGRVQWLGHQIRVRSAAVRFPERHASCPACVGEEAMRAADQSKCAATAPGDVDRVVEVVVGDIHMSDLAGPVSAPSRRCGSSPAGCSAIARAETLVERPLRRVRRGC